MFESAHYGNDDDVSSRVITLADTGIAGKTYTVLCIYVNFVCSEKEWIVTLLIDV